MADLKLHPEYRPTLSLRQTETAIKLVKDHFERYLAEALNLQRVSAPLFVRSGSGINDDLNGVEHKVQFCIKEDGSQAEVVFSLAKWKRMVLADYGFGPGEGLYTDMNAIRPDEDNLDNLHSVYVDQWDWERVITKEERCLAFLQQIVDAIYAALKRTELLVHQQYPHIPPSLPDKITYVHTEDLLAAYPKRSLKERENEIVKKYGAVFLIGIGGVLADGQIHDGRAPDYDDWTTPTAEGRKGLNGDILLWYPLLDRALEISSMGIRVDAETLRRQLAIRQCPQRENFPWHQRLLNGQFPLSIGGGIGQSRLCMYFLKKLHVGEVQASIWPDDIRQRCADAGVPLL